MLKHTQGGGGGSARDGTELFCKKGHILDLQAKFEKLYNFDRVCTLFYTLMALYHSGAPVAFKTCWGHEYMVGILCPPWVQ